MKFLIGNFKMNKTFLETDEYVKKISKLINTFNDELKNIKIGIAPSFDSVYLSYLNPNRNFLFGMQNIFHELNGAYTGEISLNVAKEAKVDFILLGHSERRNLFNETDELINKKIISLQKNNIKSILCIGESIDEFENNLTFDVLKSQINNALKNVKSYDNILISYEPVYCIGNGNIPKINHIQKVIDFIYTIVPNKVPILYGGSVCCDNIKDLKKVSNLSGFLVGKASLNPDDFVNLAKLFNK
ncbi:triose-phosphate isomerase [Metamycoplasma canadense]|uniref:Triosephosphate isomerase n=1 Tax=Metamycoplasma canadense TaxID=29554 RepID=A0A077L6G0_9BACT|nr:triose-phosphate isomerase family protein [Metamycoplasma canadense]BAP39557.1 triosephosphate isomerase [Metamycoplasma canadense]